MTSTYHHQLIFLLNYKTEKKRKERKKERKFLALSVFLSVRIKEEEELDKMTNQFNLPVESSPEEEAKMETPFECPHQAERNERK